ncbi:unnamed protein product [Rotaria sp. Silwood1]|nr:unnamed protein product [Rotaria sp. Silwood1]CAF0763806.1 unnamed protein product [Rotaria sp. Silwood1]CAF3325129.1 unnamed protein product [Rotaria sp. Silwood1]CAF3342383.1 unnamed protein product [Rotaria sp. Silwood1]CAF3346548.1 unnamed protein product [Rotaria sp. Silwood1]
MPSSFTLSIAAASGIGAFALLLLIISVGTPVWLDGGSGNTIGLFRTCYGDSVSGTISPGCYNDNRAPQAGLSIFGLLLLVFSIIAAIAGIFLSSSRGLYALYAALGLLYFSSMFVMSAYATWGVYSRDEASYLFPAPATNMTHTTVGYSYNLCVAAHYFLWTALTILAFGVGLRVPREQNTG